MKTNVPERIIYPQKVSLAHQLSPYLLLSGAVLFLLGVFVYLLGNVRVGPFQSFYQNIILNQGIARLFGTSQAKLSQSTNNLSNNSIFIILAGLVLGFNGVMIGIQPLERYKDTLFIQPALILLILFTYYPLADLIRLSFTDSTLSSLSARDYKFVGLKNFTWLFHRSGFTYIFFFDSLLLTGRYLLWETIITVGGGLLLALLFFGLQISRRFMRALVSLPRFITITSGGAIFIWMLNAPYGVLNYILSIFQIQGFEWLHDSSTTFAGILFFSAWRSLGYSMLIYFSAMRLIPADYYDAAKMEGADLVHCFRMVTLPSLKPTILYLFCVSLSSSAKVYQTFDVLIGDIQGKLKVFPLWIYDLAFQDERIGRASAVSFMYLLVLIVIMLSTMHITLRSAKNQ